MNKATLNSVNPIFIVILEVFERMVKKMHKNLIETITGN